MSDKSNTSITGDPVPESIEGKREYLLAHHIALMDSIKTCTRKGSLDADIRDVAARVLSNLREAHAEERGLDDRRIIVASSLSPSETAQLDRRKVLGFAVETGSATSHTAILARSMQLPAVVGIPPELPEKLTADDKLVMLGEKDTYEPVCRHCFAELVKNREE